MQRDSIIDKKNVVKNEYLILYAKIGNYAKQHDIKDKINEKNRLETYHELIKNCITENNGSIEKTEDNSILAIFENYNEGVLSAKNIQQKTLDSNESNNQYDEINIKIGLHFSNVNRDDDEIFDDSVKTVIRLGNIAEGYNICISEPLKKMIDGKTSNIIYIGDDYTAGKSEPLMIFGIVWKDNSDWLLNIYQETKKKVDIAKEKSRLLQNRNEGKIGNSGFLGILAQIEIRTKPEGAEIWINDEKSDELTPCTFDYHVGELDIKIEKKGYKTVIDHIEIFEHLANKLFIQLEDLRGSIMVETGQSVFDITINDIKQEGCTLPYKFDKMISGKYLISVQNEDQFSYAEEVFLEEKQDLIFKPKLVSFCRLTLISKFKNNILLIKKLDNSEKMLKPIKFETDMQFINDYSKTLKMMPGKYQIESKNYPHLSIELEIDKSEFSVFNFDDYLPKKQMKINCGKYPVSIRVKYKNRIISDIFEGSGVIERKVFPDKCEIHLKYKGVSEKIEHNFIEEPFEYDFKKIIKKSIRKKNAKKISKYFLILLIISSTIFGGIKIYKNYIFPNKDLIIQKYEETKELVIDELDKLDKENEIVDSETKEEKKEEVQKVVTFGTIKITCFSPKNYIIISNSEVKKTLSSDDVYKLQTGKYKLTVSAKGYENQTYSIVIKTDKEFSKQIFLNPIITVPSNFAFVRGGIFSMGNNNQKHDVKLTDYFIGVYEVTQTEWEAVMDNNPSGFIGENLPVENVSWYEAIEFCNKRSINENLTPCYKIDGSDISCNFKANGYRLPTEAEWEFAAKGGIKTQNMKYSGNNFISFVAWYRANSSNTTHPVGTRMPNELNIFDMSGNVWEWNWDFYGKFSAEEMNNPVGPKSGNIRLRRQGSWNNSEEYCEIGFRETASPNSKDNTIGFRYVRTMIGD